jgi:hypothetical protein
MQKALPLFDMEAKLREVAPKVYQVYLSLPMRPSIGKDIVGSVPF